MRERVHRKDVETSSEGLFHVSSTIVSRKSIFSQKRLFFQRPTPDKIGVEEFIFDYIK